MPRVVICPDKFRGTLTAREASALIAAGVRAAGIEDLIEVPLADGGEGTLEVLQTETSAIKTATVMGPLGIPVDAEWMMQSDGSAIIEMARASGLTLTGASNDPMRATSFGTGQLIKAAMENGAKRIVVAVGGSASTDGGVGALDAVGWSLSAVPVTVACDVDTRYLDAPRLFAPQKGATDEQVSLLTDRLEAAATRMVGLGMRDPRAVPGSGAAGGLAGGLYAAGAELVSGAMLVLGLTSMTELISQADIVITGEGQFDETSLSGKVVGTLISQLSVHAKRPKLIVIAGQIKGDVEAAVGDHVEVIALSKLGRGPVDAQQRAGVLVKQAAYNAVRPVHSRPARRGSYG